jgi:hypothetical protein
MKSTPGFGVVYLMLTVLTCGCSRPMQNSKSDSSTTAAKSEGESVSANLAKLSPDDRKLAEEQKYCAVLSKNLLGSMGVPDKVVINGQPVFLCCDGCQSRAKAHADRTLAKVRELKEANATKADSK